MRPETRVYEGHLDAAMEKKYVHVPFEMPPGAGRLEVTYSYSDQIGAEPWFTGGNTLDLGVFDSRGIEFPGRGFRGWSGSERSAFFITESEATPGYLAGPLPAGRWHVMLGVYKIAPAGCDYRVTVTISTAPGREPSAALLQPAVRLPASPPPARFRPWLRGELHCHTRHSDGDSSPDDVVALARERGLDFLAITDHNTTSTQRELRAVAEPGLILVAGLECTTYAGHFNVWGSGEFIDFRVTTPGEMARAVHEAASQGGLTSCNHPFAPGSTWDYPRVTNYQCLEVWNGPWHPRNQAALDQWAERLASGARVRAVGGSDWHFRRQLTQEPARAPGIPTVWAYIEETPSAGAILRAIAQGHVTLSDEPDGPFLDLRAGPDSAAMQGDALALSNGDLLPIRIAWRGGAGTVLRVLDQGETVLERMLGDSDGTITAYLPVAASRYVRAELRGEGGAMRALTNPVYLER
jgi:hypothetical protein